MPSSTKKDLRDYLLADSTVSTKLGTRLFPAVARKSYGTIDPYAVYSIVSSDPLNTQDGTSATLFRTIVFQIDIFSKSAVDAESTGDAILARVESTKFSQGTTEFGAVFMDTEFDNFEDATRADGSSGLFRKTLQLRTLINT